MSKPSEQMERARRSIRVEAELPAGAHEVWKAWTTEAGVRSFLAPEARIEAEPGGSYEIYFNPEAPCGSRGTEGMRVLAVQPESFLAFTWNAPPHLPEVRKQQTTVEIRIFSMGPESSRVHLEHRGWGTGGQWEEAFAYFSRAWSEGVFPRLKNRFAAGNGPSPSRTPA